MNKTVTDTYLLQKPLTIQWQIVNAEIYEEIDLAQLENPLDLERTVQVLLTQPNANMPQLDNYIGKYITKGGDNVALVKADGQ